MSFSSIVGLVAWGAPAMAMSRAGPPSSAVASEPQSLGGDLSGVLRVVVEGDGAEAIVDADQLPHWIRAQHPDLAEQLRNTDGHEQWVYVSVGGKTYDYYVSVVAVQDGAAVGAVTKGFRCSCNNETLISELDERIAAAAAVLRGEARAPTAKLEPHTNPPVGIEPDHGSRGLRPLGYAGIGAGVLGLGTLAAGLALGRRPDQVRDEQGQFEIRSFRNAGIGLAVGGGVVLAAGVSLLVVDLMGSRRRSLAVVPVVDGRLFGWSVARRF